MEPYVYKPLDLSLDAIRILRLRPHYNINSEIQCELIEVYLGAAGVPYEAVSYTWGGTDKPLKIIVDACELHVTVNLYTALQYLQHADQERYLWIDAICINQDNNAERGHQVGQMRLVYENAERVLIWLGTGDFGTSDLFNYFKDIDDQELRALKTAHSEAQSFKPSSKLYSELQRIFSRLLARPWFRRVWILQEVATARSATVMCGHNTMSTRIFALIPTYIGLYAPRHCQAVLNIMPGHTRRWSGWGEKRDLHTLLRKFAASEATDERDRIFALLGISSDTYNSKVILPDYTKDIQYVIQEAWYFILFRKALYPPLQRFPRLSMNEFLNILDRLPQWTLDWSIKNGDQSMIRDLFDTVDYHACEKYNHQVICTAVARSGSCDDVFAFIVSHGKVQVNVVDDHGHTLLHRMIRTHRFSAAKALLNRKDISLNSVNLYGCTPLSEAIYGGNQSMVDLLLAHPRIDVNAGKGQRTPIGVAIIVGNEGIVRALLACRDIDLNRGGVRPLVEAVESGRCQILRQLLDSGLVDVKYCNDGGAAWLMAVENRQETILSILISDKSVEHVINEDWRLYLAKAILSSFTPAVKAIMRCKDVDISKFNLWEAWKEANGRKFVSKSRSIGPGQRKHPSPDVASGCVRG
ncbi:hypothetical protein VMCG_07664 [Cytospora schulzeri]|uniref:Heterokaryon incompatibility domain-containing protein n=1 Tax=Cytospora schulzeri TaxID=448051 RepID=A0A423VZ61_9PEZI|nr:hypothetical protein VMCG_07664 [Valsa malicola]